MKVTMMGVKGGPAIRPGSNMPTSLLFQSADKVLVVDCGLGVTRGLCDAGVALTQIDQIVITHLHSDHYLELGPLLHTAWTAGLTRPIPIIGPEGLKEYWTHFCASMAFDIALRQEDEGRCPFTRLAQITEITEGPIEAPDGWTIDALRNDHPPIIDSFALRIRDGKRTAVFSGDTAYMDAMIPFAKDADLLIHEAMDRPGVERLVAKMTNGDGRLRTHILRSHTSAEDVGRIAAQAVSKRLALTHLVPDSDPLLTEDAWLDQVRLHFDGPIYVGRDGLTIDL